MNRIKQFLLWLAHLLLSWLEPGQCGSGFLFTIYLDKLSITGDLITMKAEFGFDKNFGATPVGGPAYEVGSAEWSYAATDKDGNDVSDQFTVTPDPENELRVNLKHNGAETESTGTLTLRADGDPDADETAPVVGTMSIVVDAPNVTAFELAEIPAAG